MRWRLGRAAEIFAAELLASAFFMFFGCMSLVSGFGGAPVAPLEAAFAFAFVISSIIVVRLTAAPPRPAPPSYRKQHDRDRDRFRVRTMLRIRLRSAE